jgi:hypothetical protein
MNLHFLKPMAMNYGFGSYERIEAGFAENVLRDLTGAPSEVVHNDDEEYFDKLLEGEK